MAGSHIRCGYKTRQELDSLSPSQKNGMQADEERIIRRKSLAFIQEAGIRLKLPQTVTATASWYFNKFLSLSAYGEHDPLHVLVVCLFVGSKSEEQPRRLRDVINTCYRLRFPDRPKLLVDSQFFAIKAECLQLEMVLLRQLNFDFDAPSPYSFVLHFIKCLKGSAELANISWYIITDSLQSDLCLQYEPNIIAASAIYLACELTSFKFSYVDGEWWEKLQCNRMEIEDVCHQMLDIYGLPDVLGPPMSEEFSTNTAHACCDSHQHQSDNRELPTMTCSERQYLSPPDSSTVDQHFSSHYTQDNLSSSSVPVTPPFFPSSAESPSRPHSLQSFHRTNFYPGFDPNLNPSTPSTRPLIPPSGAFLHSSELFTDGIDTRTDSMRTSLRSAGTSHTAYATAGSDTAGTSQFKISSSGDSSVSDTMSSNSNFFRHLVPSEFGDGEFGLVPFSFTSASASSVDNVGLTDNTVSLNAIGPRFSPALGSPYNPVYTQPLCSPMEQANLSDPPSVTNPVQSDLVHFFSSPTVDASFLVDSVNTSHTRSPVPPSPSDYILPRIATPQVRSSSNSLASSSLSSSSPPQLTHATSVLSSSPSSHSPQTDLRINAPLSLSPLNPNSPFH